MKILVANRGEIALRILRACREMSIPSVALYSDADKASHYLTAADESFHLGASPPAESYLNQKRIIAIAKESACSAIHPGYGFLAENHEFAALCEREGITFIGPRSETIRKIGNKVHANELALHCGIPTLPRIVTSSPSAKEIAKNIGFPVLIKAAAGGGGRGMRLVRNASELERALREAQSEAKMAFGDPTVFVEKYLPGARHVEIQILADNRGNIIYLGERECSIQRRHQKLLEESPSPSVTEEIRRRMGRAAVSLAKSAGYRNAGTVEFLLDRKGNFYFLEVNTRLQVEHPVTEMVTGIDIVRRQILIALGERLDIAQKDIRSKGHAIECRICSEDPFDNYAPATGEIAAVRLPSGPFVRVDTDLPRKGTVSLFYDSLIAKLIVWGEDRPTAIARMTRALHEYKVVGLPTTIPLFLHLFKNKKFIKGDTHTRFLEDEVSFEGMEENRATEAALLAALLEHNRRRSSTPRYRTGRPLSSWKKTFFNEPIR